MRVASTIRAARWLAIVVAVAASFGVQRARANGAFPDSLAVLLPEDRPEQIFVATNFGLLRSDDAGGSWGLVCEDAIGTLTELYAVGPAPSHRVLAITLDGLVVSNDDACSFKLVPPPLVYPSDAFVDPGDDQHVLAVAQADRTAAGRAIQGIYESTDGAASFASTPLYVAEENLNFTGLEIARSDPRTIYATLYEFDGVVGALLLRSHDGGETFGKVDLKGVLGRRLARILAIDPADPERVFLRAYDSGPTELLAIFDGVTGSVEIAFELSHRMSAFLLRSDGALIVGTREEGGYISSDAGESFKRWRGAPHLRALGERQGRLYAVADDLVDGYALAVSDDRGKSWQPLLRYADVSGPLACGEVPVICEQPWIMVQQRLDAGPGEGEVLIPDAGVRRDAGTVTRADGGDARDHESGCDCRLAALSRAGAGAGAGRMMHAFAVMAFVAIAARRRQRGRV